jgi:hypothetical protein
MLATWGCTTFPKPTLDLQFAGATSLDNRITFTRATTATFFNSSGVLSTAASGVARFDYNPTTLAARGLLIEEQRTNLALYSEELDTGWTNGSAATWQFNSGVSPAGTTTALGVDGLSGSSLSFASSTLYRTGIAISASTAYTFSIFVRTKTGTATNVVLRISETSGNSTTSSAFTVTTEWQRISLSVTSAATATSVTILVGTNSGTADLYLWGAQLEAGAFPTSYIPTTTTALTRNADVASMTGTNFSSWYNASEGTLFADFVLRQTNAASAQMLASIHDNSGNNRFTLAVAASSNLFLALRNTSGAGLLSTSTANAAIIGSNKGALAISTGASIVGNGGTVATNASYAAPVVTLMQIGNQFGAGYFNGTISRIAYYPTRLANTTLQALTA